MNPKHVYFCTLLIIWIITLGCNTDESQFPVLQGPYLGQTPPGMTPEIFAKDIVSTDQVELNAVFSPGGDTFYFTRKNPDGLYIIMFMEAVDGKWTKPQSAPFSGVYEEADPIHKFLREEVETLAIAAKTDTDPPCPGEDGRHTVEIILAALESSKQRKSVELKTSPKLNKNCDPLH